MSRHSRVRKTTAVGAGVVAECRSALDGSHWSFRVTFKQGLGHFTLEEKLSRAPGRQPIAAH
jgi:hypothetical protein